MQNSSRTILRGCCGVLLATILCWQVGAEPSEPALLAPSGAATAPQSNAPANAYSGLAPDIKLSEAAAKAGGWERRSFDFNAGDINFSSYVPAGAKAETIPEKPFDPVGQSGYIAIIGKVTFPDTPLEVSVMEYQVPSPVSALRICAYEAENSDYTSKETLVDNDLATASIYAEAAETAPSPARFFQGRCYARGNKALGVYVVYAPRQVSEERARQAAVEKARTISGVLFGNLAFQDGKPSGFGADVQAIELKIGEDSHTLTLPKVWQLKFNDFRGPLPAEMAFSRDDGRKGALWFGVRERKALPSLEQMAKDAIPEILQSWSSEKLGSVTLDESAEDPLLAGEGIMAKQFRFLITGAAGEDMGDALVVFAWHDGRLYGALAWLPWPVKNASAEDAGMVFTRMPVQTAYDALKREIVRIARGKTAK